MSNTKNPYADLLGIKTIDVGKGMAKVQAKVEAHHTNHLGYTHGGFIYSLADYAFELASNSHGIEAVGLTTNMAFHRSSLIGATLEAVATEMHLGKTVATYQVEVQSDGKLIASFTGTVYRKGT